MQKNWQIAREPVNNRRVLKYPEIPSKEISKARCHFCLSVEQAGTTNEVEGQGRI